MFRIDSKNSADFANANWLNNSCFSSYQGSSITSEDFYRSWNFSMNIRFSTIWLWL